LWQRFVNQECRRHEPLAARRLHPAKLALELPGIRLQPGEIGLGVCGRLDRMVTVEKTGNIEICADVLNHHVGRIAPAADRDVAVWQREALDCDCVRTPHDLDAGASGVRQPGRIERLRTLQILPDLVRDPLLSFGRTIAEL
jgi:hypothetical protein